MFFAYGTGTRKDGNGEGELAIRGKKPKQAEIEEKLDKCKKVFEGICWTGNRTDNKEAVCFPGKGKKLSTDVIRLATLLPRPGVGADPFAGIARRVCGGN